MARQNSPHDDSPSNDSKCYDAVIKTPIPIRKSHLAIRVGEKSLKELKFVSCATKLKPARHPYAREVVSQLREYFSDPGFNFSLKLEPQGTQYQKAVWRKLVSCPSGQVWSYGKLAQKIHSGPRAVGGACRNNPIPVVVPCHRVVSKSGIGGYAGKTTGDFLKIKQWLLGHESAN